MKKTIATILQARMDKCTNEQFWAVATLSGMNGFVLIQLDIFVIVIPNWVLIFFITLVTTYGVWFIIQRHQRYYFLRRELAYLLKKEKGIPRFLRKAPIKNSLNKFSGVVFYTGWVISIWAFTMIAILK